MDKGALALVIGKMKPGKEPDGDEGGDAYGEGLKASAADILAAIKAGDAGRLAMCLQEFFEQCDAMPHEEGSHEGE